MSDLREAAEMALEFVDWLCGDDHSVKPKNKALDVRESLRQALAQDSLRKLAEIDRELGLFDEPMKSEHTAWITAGNHTVPLEVVPSKREWVGLTEEEKDGFWKADQMSHEEWDELFAEVEAKLKEKNT